MEDELLRSLYHRLVASASGLRPPRCQFSDGLVVLIHLLSVMRNRSLLWASHKQNWPLWLRHACPAPSYSQLGRRLKTRSVAMLLRQIDAEFRDHLPRSTLMYCDGKPLVVGGFSKDPDARWGKVPDGWARGYKLHVVADSLGAIETFSLRSLNTGEAKVARHLVRRLNLQGRLLRADAAYDCNRLYAAVSRGGGRLLAPRRKPGTGLGHHPQHHDRLRAMAELEADPAAIKAHRRLRNGVEQRLAHLTNLPFGLSPLPNFVRRRRRVKRWVQGKLILYHLHLNLRLSKAQAA
jgi:Transposase DDE domain